MERIYVGKRIMWIFAIILGIVGIYYLSLTGINGNEIDEFLKQFRISNQFGMDELNLP